MALQKERREFAGMLDMHARLNKLERPIGVQRNQIFFLIMWDLELAEVNDSNLQ